MALIEEADVLLVVGCKLGEIATKRFTIPPQGQDASSISTSCRRSSAAPIGPTVALWGDVREGIRDLEAALAGDAGRLAPSAATTSRAWRAAWPNGGPASWSG